MRLNFEPAGSVFVVFRRAADGADHVISVNGSSAGQNPAPLEVGNPAPIYTAIRCAREIDVTAELAGLMPRRQLA